MTNSQSDYLPPKDWQDFLARHEKDNASWRIVSGRHDFILNKEKTGKHVHFDKKRGLYYSVSASKDGWIKFPDTMPENLPADIEEEVRKGIKEMPAILEAYRKNFFDPLLFKSNIQEICFQDAPFLNLLVPQHHIVNFSETKTLPMAEEVYFASVTTTKQIPGLTIDQVIDDRSIAESKRHIVIQQAGRQIALAGQLFEDFGRHFGNCIVADITQEMPSQFYHIDFEEAGYYEGDAATLKYLLREHELTVDMLGREALISDFSNTKKILSEKNCDIPAERKIQYNERADAALYYLHRLGI
jgi:hypothetical protein